MRGSAMGVLAAVLVAFCMVGCGRKSAQQPTKPAARKSAVPLPEWAPKDPSPEFLRAAKVLKPTPEEESAKFKSDRAALALVERVSRTWAAAYEFFGTLTDDQMQRFFATKQVRMSIKSLSPKQRAALDNWLETWRKEMKGNGSVPDDFLVVLFKMGAKNDLSNVDVGFNAQNTARRVHTIFWVRQPDGHDEAMQNDFAYM